MNVNGIYSRYKLDIKDDKIFDPIRQNYYKCTPEELVRQKTIKYLTHKLRVPKSKIIVERTLDSLGVKNNKKRIDIGILDDDNLIMAVIECKAALKNKYDTTYLQAHGYLTALFTRYFFITDGKQFEGYFFDTEKVIHLNEILKYDKWYYYPTK